MFSTILKRLPRIRLRSLSGRLVVVFALLFTAVQAAVLLLVDHMGQKFAQERNVAELELGERVFVSLMDQNRERLLQAAQIVSRDFAFREAVATADAPTIESVLRNHGARIGASVMMLASLDGNLVADSLHVRDPGRPFPRPALIQSAKEHGRASAMLQIDGMLYQVVVVPVLAPDPIAWVAMGFAIDQGFVQNLKALTGLEVSFVQRTAARGSTPTVTTHAQPAAAWLPSAGAAHRSVTRHGDFDTIISPLPQSGSDPVEVLLQRPLAEGLAAFHRLQSLLAMVTAAGIAACILGSIVLARKITQPLATLSRLANRAREGDYSSRVRLQRDDEIGRLSDSFDYMLEAIQTRQAEILRLAYHDTVTGLPNRTLFNERLREAVAGYRSSGRPAAVLLMDLDRFKSINDTLGHHAGDQVLQAVADKLRECVREPDLVARLGGDEFAILLEADMTRTWALGRMVQGIFEQPVRLDGRPIDVGLSIGVAHCPTHGEEPWLLLRCADIAMYAAKRDHSGIAVYDARLDQHRTEHLSLLSDLRRAIAEDELCLYYQPKLDLRRGQIIGVEALVRWQHPQRGLIGPMEFLPFAEQTGMITHITRWVMEQAIRQCGAWRNHGLLLHVSLNVSSHDLMDREFPALLTAAARRHAVPANCIVVEVTESALMEDPRRAEQSILDLKKQGFRLSIDDYGTGYSSLAYLQNLHCDELKVDRSFVMHVAERERDAAIVRSTVDLGHSLGMSVVAEGVENPQVLGTLRTLECDIVQGYGISRPLEARAIGEWLAGCPWSTTVIRAGALLRAPERLRAV
jgi:diguanylate cyclase (GGDEF)-like protein